MNGEGKQALKIEQVGVSIGSKSILQDISFDVAPGEFVGIIGPNGAGKSTLLRSLRGLYPISSGKVTVFDESLQVFGEKELARQIAYMQQEVNVGFGFTALQIVLTGRYPYLSWWQNEQKKDYEIARKYLAFTGVASLADKSVQQVSGGERQRILLAKVLAQETPIIFLDEPTASLDLLYQEEIFSYCQALCQQGKTVLLVAHDIKLTAKFCSRMILLAHGGIVADGTPEKVVNAENLEKAYGLHSDVFLNKVTGNLDIHTYAACTLNHYKQIHVIGGGGRAGNLLRCLHEKAYRLSCGVLHFGDTDADVAQAFGLDCVLNPSFCSIDAVNGEENRQKIAASDWTILADICFGEQNMDNLRAAFSAKKLIIIEDRPIQERDYTDGEATALYQKLAQLPQAFVMNSQQFRDRVVAGDM
jgi:iron complex transport system ATP-binding protein